MSRSQHDDADEVDVPRQLVTMTMTVCVEERALEHDAERLCEDTAIPSTKGDGMCGDQCCIDYFSQSNALQLQLLGSL